MMPWQWVMCFVVFNAVVAGVMGYYMDREELIYIRMEKWDVCISEKIRGVNKRK